MKYISWILTVPLAIVAVVFAISNRAATTLNLWPFGISVEAPLFILVLGSALVGLIAGGCIAWLSAGTSRQRRRDAGRRAEAAERELAYMRHKIEQERAKNTPPGHAPSETAARNANRNAPPGRPQLPAARA